jgi:hypothetical protein
MYANAHYILLSTVQCTHVSCVQNTRTSECVHVCDRACAWMVLVPHTFHNPQRLMVIFTINCEHHTNVHVWWIFIGILSRPVYVCNGSDCVMSSIVNPLLLQLHNTTTIAIPKVHCVQLCFLCCWLCCSWYVPFCVLRYNRIFPLFLLHTQGLQVGICLVYFLDVLRQWYVGLLQYRMQEELLAIHKLNCAIVHGNFVRFFRLAKRLQPLSRSVLLTKVDLLRQYEAVTWCMILHISTPWCMVCFVQRWSSCVKCRVWCQDDVKGTSEATAGPLRSSKSWGNAQSMYLPWWEHHYRIIYIVYFWQEFTAILFCMCVHIYIHIRTQCWWLCYFQ